MEQRNEHELLQDAVFTPCKTKDQLHKWIQIYLGLDIPNHTIDPDSNSNPMDLIWEVYDAGMKTGTPPFKRMMAYASRDSFKTLGASILEVLSIVHMRRSVAHMAAIEPQAQKAVSYVKDFLAKPYLRAFVDTENKRYVEIKRYYNKVTGRSLPSKAWEALPLPEQLKYEEIKNYLQVVICTPRGANSAHVPFFVVDEVDLAEAKAYEEAKMIPAPFKGKQPITLLTSTRKTAIGLVQKELDNQIDKRTGRRRLEVRHWNLIDVTEPCGPERHLPEEPKIQIWINDDTLQSLREDDYNLLDNNAKKGFKLKQGYSGCMKNCTLFSMCQGRLATEQKSTSVPMREDPQGLLKPIDHVIQMFADVSIPTAQAQLLCRKPSPEGLIYPHFDRSYHLLRPFQMAERITGEKYDEDTFTKADLIRLMKSRDITFHSGMDWGYTHNFAVVTGALDGSNLYIIDVIAIPGIELMQKIELCKQRLNPLDPRIYADPEDPSSIATFKKSGFRISAVKKDKGSVIGGIDIVRTKLRPATMARPQLFILSGDDGCEFLAQRMQQYHWRQDSAGNWTDEPDDKEDDECDALRYVCMSLFQPKGKFMNPPQTKAEQPTNPAANQQYFQNNWMGKQIKELTGEAAPLDTGEPAAGKRGSFSWTF